MCLLAVQAPVEIYTDLEISSLLPVGELSYAVLLSYLRLLCTRSQKIMVQTEKKGSMGAFFFLFFNPLA